MRNRERFAHRSEDSVIGLDHVPDALEPAIDGREVLVTISGERLVVLPVTVGEEISSPFDIGLAELDQRPNQDVLLSGFDLGRGVLDDRDRSAERFVVMVIVRDVWRRRGLGREATPPEDIEEELVEDGLELVGLEERPP